VIDSPYILAGIVVVIVAIVAGIVAAIVRSRADSSFSFGAAPKAYLPDDVDTAPQAADLSKLDALGGGSRKAPAPAPPDDAAETATVAEPGPAEPAIEAPPDVVDVPERDDEPLPGLWAHLVATEEGPLAVQDRIDMVSRLEMVGEKWCLDALHSATQEEQDPHVNAAVHAALTRLES
jgi:hypothetical protein